LLQRFADAQLHLVGAGSQQPALHALAVGLQNIVNVHFHGAQADITDHLHAATVVWIPSKANCGRQSALDAMAQGRAVIAFDVPCLREVIRDGETGYLVPVGDVVALARRTYMLLQDERLRERIGSAAQHAVNQQFSLNSAVQRWREVYRSAAA
jgi:glycosyltransferase involved in cell wall biosynthesis